MEQNYKYTIEIITIVVAALALISSCIIGYVQYRTQKQISKIQDESGEALLINLLIKYFVTFVNSIDTTTRHQAVAKTDLISTMQFLTACEDFRNGLLKIQSSTYLINLLGIYPEISLLEYSLVNRIAILKSEPPQALIDAALYKRMFLLFQGVKGSSNSNTLKIPFVMQVYSGLTELNNSNPQLMH